MPDHNTSYHAAGTSVPIILNLVLISSILLLVLYNNFIKSVQVIQDSSRDYVHLVHTSNYACGKYALICKSGSCLHFHESLRNLQLLSAHLQICYLSICTYLVWFCLWTTLWSICLKAVYNFLIIRFPENTQLWNCSLSACCYVLMTLIAQCYPYLFRNMSHCNQWDISKKMGLGLQSQYLIGFKTLLFWGYWYPCLKSTLFIIHAQSNGKVVK